MIRPFIKWAGGKTQLLSNIRQLYPEKIIKYCEPFVGGGAVLFDIMKLHSPSTILINDINEDLCNVYHQIKDNIDPLIGELKRLQFSWANAVNDEERKTIYLNNRNTFNLIDNKSEYVTKAALFIFLNKTCFNGLFRVNKSGKFNTPIGSMNNKTIYDEYNLREISKSLCNVAILNGDYKQCLSFIDKDTFVYIDPPYRPIKQSSFVSYHNTIFDDHCQIQLAEFVEYIDDIGAKFILSNSDPKNTDDEDDFFDNLYSKYNIQRVLCDRYINRLSNDRRKCVTELLIYN